ncbi:MAG: ATP-binding cassette domain-containing protein [Caldilineaceae bacterium SB0664_bin_27]|uniref:ATP-binding cassette domain-containing protein n=1 Tax=Caldilineaceae bacterium SB0664_bin_27 TaxID=2605260 RepID=A0A6B0YVE6_9CHLR|nr:ATP-binding cassette domain-containing protein [Caldilineaceae bacterium SB0664_bin_27]
MANDSELLLEVSDLRMYFPIQKGLLRRTTGYVKAVDGVSLSIKKGETLGLVGESGCGKTTTGRCIVRVYQPTSGEIVFHEEGEIVDINRLTRQELKSFRRNMQMIFQDPFSSLNPRMTVLELVGEPLLAHGIARGQELEDRVAEMVRAVGLRVEHLPRYPHSFSGGQRQRIGIARALVQRPKIVVCDEPVSALDVSVQSQVVNLLQDLQSDLDLTYLFVAHDMSVVRQVSNRIAVMYVGKLVEVAESEELLRSPKHPYSETLLSAVPRPNPHHHMQRLNLEGEPADPANAPPGCVFHPRCRYMEEICQTEVPTLIELTPGHHVACHFADQLELQGIDYSRTPQA